VGCGVVDADYLCEPVVGCGVVDADCLCELVVGCGVVDADCLCELVGDVVWWMLIACVNSSHSSCEPLSNYV
jgi:hypothetical protein